jgi:hypothetical protein
MHDLWVMLHVCLQDFFSMLTPGTRGAKGGASTARGAAAAGPHATVARELLDLIEFSIAALRRQANLGAIACVALWSQCICPTSQSKPCLVSIQPMAALTDD